MGRLTLASAPGDYRFAVIVLRGAVDGIDRDVRNGFEGITVRYEIDADAPRSEIDAIVAQSQKRSAVFDVVTNPTNVVVEVA